MTGLLLSLSRVHYPVTTLGYGKRVGIWTQGCSIRCPGCVSRDTWDVDPARNIDVVSLVESLTEWLTTADGVTISGGEPFDQPDALRALIRMIRVVAQGDVLVYSGYAAERLEALHADILADIDVLITDPYRATAGDSLALRGSDNQRVWLRSPLAVDRYSPDLDKQRKGDNRTLDMTYDEEEETLWMAGIVARGDMVRLHSALVERGIAVKTSQHRPGPSTGDAE